MAIIYKTIFLALIAVSAKTKDLISFKGKIYVQGPPHKSEIFIKTSDNQEIPICNNEEADSLRRLSGFVVSIIGATNTFSESCLIPEKTHILRFPYGAPAIVGQFIKATLHQAIFRDNQGQEYKFERLPSSLIENNETLILTVVPDNPLLPQNGKWKIVTYSEYPLD